MNTLLRGSYGTSSARRKIANLVSFNDVGIAALLEYALVCLKFKNVLAHSYMRCGCIAAHKNGVKEKCITAGFVLEPRRRETLNTYDREWPPAHHSPEKIGVDS